MKSIRLLLLPLLALSFLGMAKKPAIIVRFHVEANAQDGEPFAMKAKFTNPPREGFLERIPAMSERDIQAIYPVAANDGTFGCVFKFDRHGAIALETLSTERRGRMMVVVVSTKGGAHQVVDMMIDKPITDGVVYVARGLTQMEVEALQKAFPGIGTPKGRKSKERV